jgi:pimeloyl-ACP methyl ester carboxylesterase
MPELRVRRGGTRQPSILLLHGLGATCDVWDGLIDVLGDRSWVAADLPGHGRSPALPRYTFATVAEAVAALVDPAGTVIVGHSFGGVVALHLARLAGVRAVVGLGIKVEWSDDELARSAALARRPVPTFGTRAEAVARHLRVAGLDGLVDPGDPALAAGVIEVGTAAGDHGWRPAFDPRAFEVGEPGIAGLLAATRVPVVLARGEHDPMVSTAQLAALLPHPVELAGLGHNAHVENPAALLPLIADLTKSAPAEERHFRTGTIGRPMTVE